MVNADGRTGVQTRRYTRSAPRVIIGPDEVVGLPGMERVEPPPPLAVDGVGEADRRELGQPAGQAGAVDVLLPVEPLQVAEPIRRVDQRVGRVEVHLVGLVHAVGGAARVGRVGVGWERAWGDCPRASPACRRSDVVDSYRSPPMGDAGPRSGWYWAA